MNHSRRLWISAARSVAFAGAVIVPATAQADFLGLYVGVGQWNSSFEGDVVADVDLGDELAMSGSGDSGNSIYVRLEHPIPVIPNIRLARTDISNSGTGTLSTNFEFNGQTFTPAQTVANSIDLTHTDFTLYYEVVDIGFDLDFGLTARHLDGKVSIGTAEEDVSGVLPMLFVHGKFGLPLTGTYLGVEGNVISFSGNRALDYALKIGWETENFILPEFGIEVGYRRFGIEGEASDIDVGVDVAVDGIFINLTGHF